MNKIRFADAAEKPNPGGKRSYQRLGERKIESQRGMLTFFYSLWTSIKVSLPLFHLLKLPFAVESEFQSQILQVLAL